MAAGNGDTSYMPLKSEYPDEVEDDELPDENDFIAPVDYIDPVSCFSYKFSSHFLT